MSRGESDFFRNFFGGSGAGGVGVAFGLGRMPDSRCQMPDCRHGRARTENRGLDDDEEDEEDMERRAGPGKGTARRVGWRRGQAVAALARAKRFSTCSWWRMRMGLAMKTEE